MKTTINAETLKKALKSAKVYATEKSPWPTCKNVKMEALNGGIILTSTDREKTVKAVIPCEVENAGSVLLSPAAVKTLEAVKSETVTIEATENTVKISSGFNVVTLAADDPGDFPTEEKTERIPLFSCTGKDFEKLVRVLPFTENENGRYALGGVLLDFQEVGACYSVATDGKRMGVQKIGAATAKNGILILFACDLKTLAKHFAKSEKITVYENAKDANIVTFADAEKEFSVRLLEGRFPEWRLGMKQLGTNAKKAFFPACELQKLTELKTFVSASDPGVFFRPLPGVNALAVTTQNRETEIYLHADFQEWEKCAINIYFLLDLVKICGKEELNLEYIDYKNGYLFTCEDFQYLVMPMNKETATQATKRLNAKIRDCRERIEGYLLRIETQEKALAEATEKNLLKEQKNAKETIRKAKDGIKSDYDDIEKAEKEIARLAAAVKKEEAEAEEDAKKAEALKKEWGESATKPEQEKAPSKTAKKTPISDASTATAPNTPTVEKAEQTQAEEQETAKEETTEKPEEKRVKIAPTGSSAPLATVPEPEPENRSAAADQNGHAAAEPVKIPTPTAAAEPEPMEEKPEPERSGAEKPFEIGTYTTKKGKAKTAIKFNITPLPEWIEALKRAFYWEYNGTWNGSPRKLPEIFKH